MLKGWVRKRNRYVCPVLISLSFWMAQLRGKKMKWSDGSAVEDLGTHGCELFTHWPLWMIKAECWFWNTRVGMRLR